MEYQLNLFPAAVNSDLRLLTSVVGSTAKGQVGQRKGHSFLIDFREKEKKKERKREKHQSVVPLIHAFLG